MKNLSSTTHIAYKTRRRQTHSEINKSIYEEKLLILNLNDCKHIKKYEKERAKGIVVIDSVSRSFK